MDLKCVPLLLKLVQWSLKQCSTFQLYGVYPLQSHRVRSTVRVRGGSRIFEKVGGVVAARSRGNGEVTST